MDESAPITWLIDQINTIVASGASGVADAISGGVAPIASACFGIYILLMTVNYMRGAESEPAIDFILKMAAWAVIIGFGLNAASYDAVVMPIVTGLGTDLGNLASGGTVTAGTLDQLALLYLKIINDGFTAAQAIGGLEGIGVTVLVCLKAIIIVIGLVPFLVAATLSIIVANVGSQIIAMVGPLFFAFLLFPATRQYFSAWVNTALSYALIPLIIAIVASISVGISTAMLPPTTALTTVSFQTVFLAAIGNLILLFFLKQVAALASSLSAGGINMAMPGGVGSAASGAANSMKQSAKEAAQMKAGYSAVKGTAGRVGQAIANRFNSIRRAG